MPSGAAGLTAVAKAAMAVRGNPAAAYASQAATSPPRSASADRRSLGEVVNAPSMQHMSTRGHSMRRRFRIPTAAFLGWLLAAAWPGPGSFSITPAFASTGFPPSRLELLDDWSFGMSGVMGVGVLRVKGPAGWFLKPVPCRRHQLSPDRRRARVEPPRTTRPTRDGRDAHRGRDARHELHDRGAARRLSQHHRGMAAHPRPTFVSQATSAVTP